MTPQIPMTALAFVLITPAMDVELRSVPTADTTVRLTVTQSSTANLESEIWFPVTDGEIQWDEGEDVELEDPGDDEIEMEFELVDHVVEVEDGRRTIVERTFPEFEMPCALAERVVRFEWNADDEAYDASFADDGEETDVDDTMLGGLTVDIHGDWFLPDPEDAELEEGATWTLPVMAWQRCYDLGGDYWMGVEPDQISDGPALEMRRQHRRQRHFGGDGEVECTFTGMRELDGESFAVITFETEYEVEDEVDRELDADEAAEINGEGTGATRIYEREDAEVSVEGECLWDVRRRRPRSITFDASVTTTMSFAYIDLEDESEGGDAWRSTYDVEMEIELSYDYDD